MDRNRILIITKDSFPKGGAATNRMLSYCVPLSKKYHVKVLTLYPTKYNTTEESPSEGIVDGSLRYEYVMPASTPEIAGIIKRTIDRIRKRIRLFSMVKNYKPLSVIYVARDMTLARQLKLFSYPGRYRLYREISESPEYITNSFKRWFVSQQYRMFDGMIVITQAIRNYFYFLPDNLFFHLPMTVSLERFKGGDNTVGDYFFYCSGGNSERDGLLDIIKGFIAFSKEDKSYKLKLATTFNDNNKYDVEVKGLIKSCPAIEYLGRISSDAIPEYMEKAVALLITPHKDYATRGFPTKLGEYMASKRPVICSSITTLKSEIDENAVFFVRPNSPNDIKDALMQLAKNSDLADTIGKNGRLFVESHFYISPYLDGLSSFLGLNNL